jgi:hypothetical protein
VGKQFFDAVDRMRGDPFQYVGKVFQWINAVELTGANQAVDEGTSFGRVV